MSTGFVTTEQHGQGFNLSAPRKPSPVPVSQRPPVPVCRRERKRLLPGELPHAAGHVSALPSPRNYLCFLGSAPGLLFPKPSLRRTQPSTACLPGIPGEASDCAQACLAGSPLRAPLSVSTAEPACDSSRPKSWREEVPGGSAGTRCLRINCVLQLNCPIPQRNCPTMSGEIPVNLGSPCWMLQVRDTEGY